MKRATRWIVRIIVAIAALVVLEIVGMVVALHTTWGRDFVRREIASQLDKAFIGGGHIGTIEGDPFGELVVHDLEIDAPDGRPAITARVLRVHLAILPLLRHRVRVDHLVADGVEIVGRRGSNGELDLGHLRQPQDPAARKKKGKWSIELHDVTIHHARVAITTGPEPITVDDIEVIGGVDFPRDGAIGAHVIASGHWRERDAVIAVSGAFAVGDERVDAPLFTVAVGDIGVIGADVHLPRQRGAASGTIAASVPARTLERLVGAHVPADVAVAIAALPTGGAATELAIDGTLGDTRVRAVALADPSERRAHGFATIDASELRELSRGRVHGRGTAIAAFDVATGPPGAWPNAHGLVALRGELGGAVVALDVGAARAQVTALVGAAGGVASVFAAVRRDGAALHLDRAALRASVADPTPTVRGKLHADLSATGELRPRTSIAVAGRVDGELLRARGVSMRELHARVDLAQLPAQPRGTARVELDGLARGRMWLERAVLAAGSRPDGRLQVSLRSSPERARWRADLDALVAFGDTIVIDLQRHDVVLGDSEWRGTTGHAEIGRDVVSVRDLRSTSDAGSVVAGGSYVRAGSHAGDLAANVSAKLDVSKLDAKHHGNLTASVQVARRAGAWTGRIGADANHVASWKAKDFVDGKLEIVADGRTIRATASAGAIAKLVGFGLHAGTASLAVEVAAPNDPTKLASWRALRRDAIHRAELTFRSFAIGKVGKTLGSEEQLIGLLDGSIAITPTDIGGSMRARGIAIAPLDDLFGLRDAELHIASTSRTNVSIALDGGLTEHGKLHADVQLALPDRLVDPDAWGRLGTAAIRSGEVRATKVPIGPALLERLGVSTDVRATGEVALDVGPGARDAHLVASLDKLRGGPLVEPVGAKLDARLDANATTASIVLRARDRDLLDANVRLAVPVTKLRAARTAALRGTITIPSTDLPALAAVFGNHQPTRGTLAGTIAIAGTLARPTASATLTARDVAVAGAAPALSRFELAARWDGNAGNALITATESNGGTVRAELRGSLARTDLAADLRAQRIDLAPFVAFLPGIGAGIAGRLDADLRVRGGDVRTADISGTLAIHDARLPIAPQIGTLFHGDASVDVKDRVVTAKLAGSLGSGTIKLAASAPLAGASVTTGKAELTLDRVQLVGDTQPIVTATITSDVKRDDDHWRAHVHVGRALVKIPKEKGEKLRPVGKPKDVIFGDPKRVERQLARREQAQAQHAPGRPVLVADIDLAGTRVESDEFRGTVGGTLELIVGERGVGAVGTIAVDHGEVTLFDRRYSIERAALHYDGSLDPELDIRISHDFPDVTLTAVVTGRMSKPSLRLSSDPASHSQEELLGWLLGGEPSGNPNSAPSTQQRVEGAGASIVANAIGGYVKQALPIDLDVLKYEAATATSSSAVLVGTWLTHDVFVAYREHLSARPDENSGEADVEYWLLRHLVVQGTVGDRGYDAVDLLWRRRW